MEDKKYSPKYLSWCTSLEHEEKEMRRLIESGSDDIKLLKEEYHYLTGKRYRRKEND